jgi:hypothetical protein
LNEARKGRLLRRRVVVRELEYPILEKRNTTKLRKKEG